MIHLEIDGLQVPLQVTDRESRTSPHTGRALDVLSAQAMVVGGAAHNRFLDAVSQKREAKLTQEGEDDRRWTVSMPTWSTEQGSGEYRYVLRLEEQEEYTVERIRFDRLVGEALRYEEDASNGSLTITTVVRIVKGDHQELLELWGRRGYFEVWREGIESEDSPRSMRFGVVFWSKHEEGNKYRLVLVDRSYDEVEERGFGLSEFDMPDENARDYLARVRGVVKGLMNLLVEKDVADEDDMKRILADAEEARDGRVFDFYRVGNAEDTM